MIYMDACYACKCNKGWFMGMKMHVCKDKGLKSCICMKNGMNVEFFFVNLDMQAKCKDKV